MSEKARAERETSLELVNDIKGRIKEKGSLSFTEFMALALYHEKGGYYTSTRVHSKARDDYDSFSLGRSREGVLADVSSSPVPLSSSRSGRPRRPGPGFKGDFITTLDISPLFGVMLARQFYEMWQLSGKPSEFYLIEVGAGRGWLSKWVLETIRERYKDFALSIKPCLIDKNITQDNLDLSFADFNLQVFNDLSEIKEPLSVGCIFSNELIDALPVHRVVMRQGKLKEIYVDYIDGNFIDSEGEPSTSELEEYFIRLGITLSEGQVAEVSLEALLWIKNAGELLLSGFVLTIDYGSSADKLYSPGRIGTLLCHYKHKTNQEFYKRIGEQDITAHVDFTSLASGGKTSGLTPLGFTSQRAFLLGLGITEEGVEVPDAEDKDITVEDEYKAISHNQGIRDLVLPGGIGDTMQVLIQVKNIKAISEGESKGLEGFSFKNSLNVL
ncbi:MAG: SAM-dependent methyltransferase [Deltaproteobacteria bacterium]|nr:SAM-dependent methyltransferase [Deltaproteobacteria bacterium]